MTIQINSGGAAFRDGRLNVGHRLLEVNGQSLLGCTHAEAVKTLRIATEDVSFLVCHGYDSDGTIDPNDVSTRTLNAIFLCSNYFSALCVFHKSLIASVPFFFF